jgi:myo-inositol-1(or 4)-monophosphatase
MNENELLSRITLKAIEAALHAGSLLKRGFGTHFSVSSKSVKMDLVTEYDRLSEDCIIKQLRSHFPSSGFLAEESGRQDQKNASLLWIIDPLDGTVNFAHQIPVFAISIAAQKEGQTVCGIIYQPMTTELFVAEKGRGAYLNGEKIHVSKTSSIDEVFLASGFPYTLKENPMHCIERFNDMLHLGIPIRRLGAAAVDLAYTAAGRFDGFFEVDLAPWDCAAANLLIEEAGGTVSSWSGKKYDLFAKEPIVASNGLIHSFLVDILKQSCN